MYRSCYQMYEGRSKPGPFGDLPSEFHLGSLIEVKIVEKNHLINQNYKKVEMNGKHYIDVHNLKEIDVWAN